MNKTPYQRFSNWKSKNPDKLKANRLVFVEKRAGRLTQQPCEQCGNEETQAHHDDYSRPLEIRWLCKSCHIYYHVISGSYAGNGRKKLLTGSAIDTGLSLDYYRVKR